MGPGLDGGISFGGLATARSGLSRRKAILRRAILPQQRRPYSNTRQIEARCLRLYSVHKSPKMESAHINRQRLTAQKYLTQATIPNQAEREFL